MMTVRLAAGLMLRYPLYWGRWALPMVAVAYLAIGTGVANLGTPGAASSVWASSIWFLQWLAFPAGIAVGYCFPILVAHGITRRSAIAGGSLAVCGLALLTAAMVQAGLAVERLIYRASGMPYRIDGFHLFDAVGQVHLVLAEYGLNLASFLVSGLLMYLVYYRFRWRGTLVAPLALVPPAGAVLALSTGFLGPPGEDPVGPDAPAAPALALALALALAAVAAGLAGAYALARTMPITSRQA